MPAISTQQIDQVVNSLLQQEREPINRLESERSGVEESQEVIGELDSTLSSFESSFDALTDRISNPFAERSAEVPEGAGFSIDADANAATGNHSLEVERLASTDTRVSDRLDADGDDLVGRGEETFTLDIATGDDNERVSIDVTVDSPGETNEEVLRDVAAAIDSAMAEAVDDEVIANDERPNVSVVNETTDTARLTVTSADTGFENRLEFSNDADGLLDALGIDNDQEATGTEGGQITPIGEAGDSELDSQFVLDGLTFNRPTNTVDDALDGVTLNLEEADQGPSSFAIDTDTEAIEDNVQEFIDGFNAVQEFIQEKTEVDPDENTRGEFASDTAIRSIRFNLRNEAIQTVDSQPDGAPSALADIGITLDDDGLLELDDSDALLQAAEQNPEALQDLFTADDGVATRMAERVEGFIGPGGSIDQQEQTAENRIERIDDRIERIESRLERREDQLRDQFTRVQEAQQSAQAQQQSLQNFFGGGGFF